MIIAHIQNAVNAKLEQEFRHIPRFLGKITRILKEGEKNLQKLERWAALRRPFLTGLALGAFLLLLPLAALGGGGSEPVAVLPARPTPAAGPSPAVSPAGSWDGGRTLRVLQKDGTVQTISMADYLLGVVSAEMPASFEPEALRAQAVCARTYALRRAEGGSHAADGADVCADSSCCQAYISPADAAARWGVHASEYAAKLSSAVADTDGQVLTYGGSLIQAVFFSSAAGATEDAAAVWGSALPYLVSVDSPEGDEVPNYRSSLTLSAGEVKALAEGAGLGCDLSGDPAGWFSGLTRTASGRVASLSLGGVSMTGGAARSLFSLRSTAFDVAYDGGSFTFSVTGYGHGVGLSQYGANAMAKEGASWRDIVEHYYTGVTVQTWI